MKLSIVAVSALVLLAPSAASAAKETIETIPSRPGVTVRFIVTPPAKRPVAAAILFTGSDGQLGLWRGEGTRSKNFLVRSRARFAAAGVLAVTVDVPSDRRRRGLRGFRGTAEHRADIEAVIRWIRKRTGAPLWLIGTSRGTISAAYLAAGGLPVDGVVLTTTLTRKSARRPANVLDADLARIRVPVLLVHHERDICPYSPVSALETVRRRLTGARKVATLLFDSGDPPKDDACRALSAHGFLGIEVSVVAAIVDWITANGPKRSVRRADPARR